MREIGEFCGGGCWVWGFWIDMVFGGEGGKLVRFYDRRNDR